MPMLANMQVRNRCPPQNVMSFTSIMHFIPFSLLLQKLDNMGDNDVELVEAVEACVQLRRDAKVCVSVSHRKVYFHCLI